MTWEITHMPQITTAPTRADAGTEAPRGPLADEPLRRVEAIARQAYGESLRPSTSATAGVLVVTASGPEGERWAEAARAVFAEADIDVDLCFDPATPGDLAARWSSSCAVLIIASARHASRMRSVLQGLAHAPSNAVRTYGLVVEAEPGTVGRARARLTDELDDMGLIDAVALARLERFTGWQQPGASASPAWAALEPLLDETLNAARAVANAVLEIRAGRLCEPDRLLAKVN